MECRLLEILYFKKRIPSEFSGTKGINIKEYGNLSIIDYPGLSDEQYSNECKGIIIYHL